MNSNLFAQLSNEQKLLAVSAAGTMILLLSNGYIFKLTQRGWNALTRKLRILRRLKSELIIGSIRISDDARLRHTHIVGATGSGKTVLIEKMLYSDLARGLGALVIDPKGDREFYERIRSYCRSIGRESDLHLLSASRAEESVLWNPCRLGDVSELQSKFFNSSIYDHHFYAKAVELGLLRAFQSLNRARPQGFDLHDLCQTLQGMAAESKDETLKGLFFDLNSLALSEWGDLFCGGGLSSSKREITLFDITRRNEILFVDLPTEAKKTQSQRIGRLLLQEFTLLSGMRKNYPHLKGERPFSIYIDEFDAFATPGFATFLNKGRSSAFMIHLAHQTLSDLSLVSKEFAGQIMGNTNVRFIFRQDDPDDAETWSRFFGTRNAIKRTFQTQDGTSTGLSSNREVLEFRISPDTIKDLPIGECVVSIKTDRIFEKIRVPYSDGEHPSQPKLPMIRESLNSQQRPSFKANQSSKKTVVRETVLENIP